MSSDLFQQGVEAFRAGNKVRAKEIMQQITAAEPNNENAWYYLAAAETDETLRHQYLERVLQINPGNARAREILAKLDARTGSTASAAVSPSQAPRATLSRSPDLTSGFALPFSIPGAPSEVSLQSLFKDGWELVQKGLEVLQRKEGVYEGEVAQATWWRFWLLVAFGYAITTIFSVIGAILTQGRLASLGFRFNLLGILGALILTIPIGLLSVYAGVYASHWWAKRQGGQIPLYQHAYAIALPYVPAWVIGSALGLIFSFIGFGGGLIALIVSLYALYIIALGFDKLYRFSDPNQKWFTVGAMFVGSFVASLVIGAVVGVIFGTGQLLGI